MINNLTQPISCDSCKTPAINYYIWHSGGISGVTTLLAVFPEQEFVVSVLSNLGFFTKINDVVLNIANNFL